MRRSNRIIYCARNILNNKSYIGWCTDFKERKARHIRSSELGSKTRFHNALRKYGSDYFEWFILFEDLNSQDDCKRMEMRMIALFDTYANGYNSTIGGDGGFTGYNSGQFKPGNKTWNTGKKMSIEIVAKFKVADRSLSFKPVAQLDKHGNLIKAYKSVNHASEATGIHKSNIAAVCRNHENRKQSGGFKWAYIK